MGVGTRVLAIISFVVFLGSYLFFIVATATPWWYVTTHASAGLWAGCVRITTDTDWECDGISLGDHTSETKAALAMAIVGHLVYIPCLVCYIIALCKDLSLIIASVLCAVGGGFTVVVVAVYGSQFSDVDQVGWSFALACVSCGVSTLNGILTLLIKACC